MKSILFFDLFASTFLIFLGVSGFRRGFLMEIERIVGLVFSMWLAISYYVDLATIIHQKVDVNPYIVLFTSFSIIFIGAFIGTKILIELIDKMLGTTKKHFVDQIFGFVFGALKGTIPIVLLLWSFELLPVKNIIDTVYENSVIARSVKYIRDTNVDVLGWKDPVKVGENYLKSVVANDPVAQDSDE